MISHNAGGYSFYQNAEHQRITRFRANGVPLDRPGHYVYLRDDETGEYWSVSWQPVGKDLAKAKLRVPARSCPTRGSRCDYQDLQAEQLLFIPPDDDVELWDVRIRNSGSTKRTLSVFGYVEFCFHHIEIDNQNLQMSLYASGSSYAGRHHRVRLLLRTVRHSTTSLPASIPTASTACATVSSAAIARETNPIAVEQGRCHGSAELGGNHCGALHKRLTIEPGEEVAAGVHAGRRRRAPRAGRSGRNTRIRPMSTAAFADLQAYWTRQAGRVPVPRRRTRGWTRWSTSGRYTRPRPAWSGRASPRSSRSAGAPGLGYRDTSQDVMSVVHTNPAKCRQRIVELLKAQVSMGYGLHLFDPDWFDPGEAEGAEVQIADHHAHARSQEHDSRPRRTRAPTTCCGWSSRSAST